MAVNIGTLGVAPAGSRIVAAGNLTDSALVSFLVLLPIGTLQLWTRSQSGSTTVKPVALPPDEEILGVGAFSAAAPGTEQLLLRDGAGKLAYAAWLPAQGTFTVTPLGNPGEGWRVVGQADFNSVYNGNDQVLLQATGQGATTLWPYLSQLPAFTLPPGFTAVANASGNFFGSDLPATLIVNTSGTVEAVLQGLNLGASPPASLSVTSILGTLAAGDTIEAAVATGATGTAAVLIRNGNSLSEWSVHAGAVTGRSALGDLPPGATVAGFTDLTGDGVPDVLMMLNTGTIAAMLSSGSVSNPAPMPPSGIRPPVSVDSGYNATTRSGVDTTLSAYVAQLASGALAATGARILVVQAGAICQCSFEQVAAGNITFAAWQQNVATLNALAQACREQGIVVQVEASLGLSPSWGLQQTEQWLQPAIAAGLPVGFVEDDNEVDPAALNVGSTIARILQNIAFIHAAYPDARFGEWRVLGSVGTTAGPTAYQRSLQAWWTALNGAAAAAGLPGLSYVVADQYYSPVLAAGTSKVDAAGASPGADVTLNQFAGFAAIAKASGMAVQTAAAPSTSDLTPLQALARQVLQVSQEAALGIASVRLDSTFNRLPVLPAVNVAGSTYNAAAVVAAIEPLYQSGRITATGPVSLSLPPQRIVAPGVRSVLGGFALSADQIDSRNTLAVILIDQNGTLSAARSGQATVVQAAPNILVLQGSPADVQAELASVSVYAASAGPDSIDIEVLGVAGRLAGGAVALLATPGGGSASFAPGAGGAGPPPWTSASATVSNGRITTETFSWNTYDGLSSDAFLGGTTIRPVIQIPVAQPLLEQGLSASGGAASLPASVLTWHTAWQTYEPLRGGPDWASEIVPVTVANSELTFDPVSGQLAMQIDTLAPVPASEIAAVFPFAETQPYYFAQGGVAVTTYAVAGSQYWSGTPYAGGAGGVMALPGAPNLMLAAGSTTPMQVGSVTTISGIVNGVQRVVEVRYHGGSANPYDEIDQIFDPYAATPVLWQQIQTVALPPSMTVGASLTVPSATTIIEFNTGNNPNWSDTIWTQVNGGLTAISATGAREVATTFEGNNWDAQVQIAADGAVAAQRGVTWIGEGQILAAYRLAAPSVRGISLSNDSGLQVTGAGIAGDWVTVTGSDGKTLGGAQVDAAGTWRVTAAGFTIPDSYTVSARQFDLAGDSSATSAAFAVNRGSIITAGTGAGVPAKAHQNLTPDILFQNQSGQLAQWTLTGSSISSSSLIGSNPGPSWFAMGVGAFYAGDTADIVWQNDNGAVAVWQVQGTNVLGGAIVANPGTSWHIEGTGNFYGAGNTDILWQNDNGSVALWEMQGASIIRGDIVAANPGPTWHIQGTGDFYGDGATDILWQNDNGSVALWEMQGASITRGDFVTANPGPSWHIKGTGDFYGDGNTDILWQNDNGSVALWEMQGASIIRGDFVAANLGSSWRIKAVGDFNNDGKADIAWQNDNGSVAISEMDGSNIVASAVLANPGTSWSLLGGGQNMRFIYSTSANDTLAATQTTADEFVFTNVPVGDHTITGFNVGQDIIGLSSAVFDGFAAVQAATSAAAGGTLIRLGAAGSLFLPGVDASSLHASNFALA